MRSGSGAGEDARASVTEFHTAVMRLARRLRNERQEDHLTPSQIAVLATLLREGPLTLANLAAVEHVQPPSMTRIVTILEQGGWVEKLPHPQDRRQLLVQLTPQAEAWVRMDHEAGDSWLAAQLANLTDSERGVLAAAAQIMNRLATAP